MENPYDGHTIDPLPAQKGKNRIRGVTITSHRISRKPLRQAYQKRKKRRRCRTGAAIEAIIGHLKKDFRMEQNHLWGEKGVQINAMMAATTWNLKKMMEKLKQ